jgi:uncharacterized protein
VLAQAQPRMPSYSDHFRTAVMPASSRTEPADLDTLNEFLMSDRAPENSMGLSDLDGFLTALAIGPEPIPAVEWLPVIWGGDAPDFANAEEEQRILATIEKRHEEIVRCLADHLDELDPVFWEGPGGKPIVTDWAAGFLDAVALRPSAWEPLVQHPEGQTLILPLLLLGADGPEDIPFDGMPLPEVDEERLLAAGAGLVLGCVEGIAAFWKAHSSAGRSAASRLQH